MVSPQSLHIFCHVIDNLGDVGVCWRLSRQFALEHCLDVTLWVDDLHSLKRLCSTLDAAKDAQRVDGLIVRRWPQDDTPFSPEDIGDVVIEAFACHLPASYVSAMAQRVAIGKEAPAWINLEYLSAEAWIEGCHALPSPHPSLPLTKHFFFPGFTDKTGGLILERDLFVQRDAFQRDMQAMTEFLGRLGVQAPAEACKVSLFCYPTAPVGEWLAALAADDCPVVCLVPQGVAVDAVSAFLGCAATAGAVRTKGSLTVQVIPFLTQSDYDKLLWASDINFVRGEDSFVRAQWAGKPFVWQIYPQAENAHVAKLDAFLGRYVDGLVTESALSLTRFHLGWNAMRQTGRWTDNWRVLRATFPQLRQHGAAWVSRLVQHGDLARNLLHFVRQIG